MILTTTHVFIASKAVLLLVEVFVMHGDGRDLCRCPTRGEPRKDWCKGASGAEFKERVYRKAIEGC